MRGLFVLLPLSFFSLTLSVYCGGEGGDQAAPGVDSVGESDAAEISDVSGEDAAPAPLDTREPQDTSLPSPRPGFHTEGVGIVDDLGRQVILHGANVSNAAKRDPDHMTWQTAADLEELAATGLNSVRYVMSWAAIMPSEGQIDEGWLDRLATRIGWLHDAGMLVVLDMHQDLFGEGFGDNGAPVWACDQAIYDAYEPTTPWWKNYMSPQIAACFDHLYTDDVTWGHFTDAWVAVAERFADNPAVVGFDLLNEPHWGTSDLSSFVPERWQPRQEQLAAAIHAVAPDKVVFFEAPPLLSLGLVMEFSPAGGPDIAFAPHYYHPGVHEGQAYGPSQAPDITNAMDAMSASAVNLGGVPVWLGEIGAAPSLPTFGAYARELLRQIEGRGWGWAWWSDDKSSESFGLRDLDGVLLPHAMAILGHPYARRIPGELRSQRIDFEAGRFEARFSWRRDAPLELWVGLAPLEVRVTPVDELEGTSLPCAPSAGAPEGVLECPAPERIEGAPADYRALLRWAP